MSLKLASGRWGLRRRKLLTAIKCFSAEAILFLDNYSGDKLIGISRNGIHYLSSANLEVIAFYPQNWENRMISCIEKFRSDLYAVGTLDGNIFFSDEKGELRCVLPQSDNNSTSPILSLRSDDRGNLWSIEKSRIRRIHLEFSASALGYNLGFSVGFIRDLINMDETIYMASDEGVFAYDLDRGCFQSLKSINAGETNSIERYDTGLIFDRYSKLNYFHSENLHPLHEFDREIWTFTLVGERVVVGFSDRMGVYRLTSERRLEPLWEHPLASGLRVLEADGTGTLWGWDPMGPVLEFKWQESGGFREIRHEVIGGIPLRGQRHEFSMTEEGPVLVIGDRIARYRGAANGWEVAPLEGLPGTIEAITFDQDGPNLTGWLVSWDAEMKSHFLGELRWEGGSRATTRLLPWIDMNELGRINLIPLL
jgi:hypothetical protein